MKKAMAVFAHPDDEAFGPGGTLYKLAQDHEVRLICVTNGDAELKFNQSGKENLGDIRIQELLNSAKILGISKVDFLGFKDGSLCNNNYHEVAEKIKNLLDKFKPETILTFDQNGVSGHLDHVAVSMICSFLYERLGYVKKIMYFCNDKIHKQTIGTGYFVYFPEGLDRKVADEITNCQSFIDKKLSAMRCHVSQSQDCEMIINLFGDYLQEEYFKVLKK